MKINKIITWIFSIIIGLLFIAFCTTFLYAYKIYSGSDFIFQFSFINMTVICAMTILSILIVIISHKLIVYFSNNFGEISDLGYVSRNSRNMTRQGGEPKSSFLRSFIPITGVMIICLPIILWIISHSTQNKQLAFNIQLGAGLFLALVVPIIIAISILIKNARK